MEQRAHHNGLDKPISVYEVHPGSWRAPSDGGIASYRQLAHELVVNADLSNLVDEDGNFLAARNRKPRQLDDKRGLARAQETGQEKESHGR